MSDQVLDCVGVPEYFFEYSEMEDAGNGLVRIIRCIKRHGMLIPVCSTVSPALSVLRLGLDAEPFARKIPMESYLVLSS